jgi:hypothetical protein
VSGLKVAHEGQEDLCSPEEKKGGIKLQEENRRYSRRKALRRSSVTPVSFKEVTEMSGTRTFGY